MRRSGPGKAFPVSWDQFHRDCRALTWRLNEVGPFDAIIAITRGGLVPAAIVARELGMRIIETRVHRELRPHQPERPEGSSSGVSADTAALGGGTGKGLLIVDDLVDTGKTGRLVRDMMPDAHFATVYAKPKGGRWSTRSSPRYRKTPGFSFPGIPRSRSSRRSATARRDFGSSFRGDAKHRTAMCNCTSENQDFPMRNCASEGVWCCAPSRNDEGGRNRAGSSHAAAKSRHPYRRHHRRPASRPVHRQSRHHPRSCHQNIAEETLGESRRGSLASVSSGDGGAR